MKRNKKIIMAVAGCCIVIGIALFGIGTVLGGTTKMYIDNKGIHASKTGEGDYILKKTKVDEFDSIDIHADYADVAIIPSDGYYLEYHLSEDSNEPYYHVANKKLTVKESPGKSFFIGLGNFGSIDSETSYYIRVYVPEEIYLKTVKIHNESGSTASEWLQAEKIDLENEYGDISIGTLKCRQASVVEESGNVEISELEAEQWSAENEYGNIVINRSNVGTAKMVLESGSLILKDADYKHLDAELEYGDAAITLSRAFSEYEFDLHTEYGKISIPGAESVKDDGEEFYRTTTSKENSLKILCESGNITIEEQ